MEKRLAVEISSLNRFLERIGSYAKNLIFSPDVPLIRHYTDLTGLEGIISNHDLWLTHSRYSNDDEELTYGFRVVNQVIAEELKQSDRKRKNYLRNVQEILSEPHSEGVYVCCFCQDDDLLSQWRGYGANGTGVCVSFKTQCFSYITGPDSPNRGLVRMWKVFYNPKRQRDIIRKALEFGDQDDLNCPIKDRARKAVDAILFFVPTFKNQKFEAEDEVRLIFTPEPEFSKQPKFRVSRGMLTPYYSLIELSGSSPHLPIASVRIGPSVLKELNAESVRMLLVQAGYPNVIVETSDTPYRG